MRTPVYAVPLLLAAVLPAPGQPPPAPVSEDEAAEIAVEAYIYAYPMLLMDTTRRVRTNAETADTAKRRAPVNQFSHAAAFPDARFTDVVRPNADTLYSTLWFDVTAEPLVIRVPDSGGRYYLLQMLDLWTDVFAAPGKRTSGTGTRAFAVIGPKWEGKLPDGVEAIRAPTGTGWVIGRTQTNGAEDYANVHKFQAGITAAPLSAWGKDYTPPKGKFDAAIPNDPPPEQVAKMDAATFFARFAELTKDNPPHANDHPMLARLRRIGLEPGKPFDLAQASPEVRRALEKAAEVARKKIAAEVRRAGVPVNHWRMLTPPIGTYGTDYLRRAGVAFFALGANVSEDSLYPTALTDADGKSFDSAGKYVLQFPRGQLPPVRAFWSLTMYNDRQFFADNPINRFALGDRDKLTFNDDGSLTLYIQRMSPGKERESNWLPAPKEGGFSMNLRLYWPRPEALDGTWKPPPVRRVEE
jgi:hypothetical protein